MKDMARAERADLASFLETLAPQEWAAPSLCDKWTVKDVVAQVVSYDDLGTFGLIRRFVKGAVVHANEVGVEEFSSMTPEELLAHLESHLDPRGLAAAFGGMIGLVDWTHGSGPEVSGSGEALMMAITGGGAAVTDLTGPGVATLARRM